MTAEDEFPDGKDEKLASGSPTLSKAMIAKFETDLLNHFEVLDEDTAALMMDCNVETLIARRRAGTVLGLQRLSGEFSYPKWQFRWDGQPFAEIADILSALDGDGWKVLQFMAWNHETLRPNSTIEWLRISREPILGELARSWKAERDEEAPPRV